MAEPENYNQLVEAARALYEEVEMAESVGICLPDRVPSLRLGQILNALPSLGASFADHAAKVSKSFRHLERGNLLHLSEIESGLRSINAMVAEHAELERLVARRDSDG